MRIIRIAINSVHEIASAYESAIKQYADDGDCWDCTIKLREIEFQANFRRTEYECVFEIINKQEIKP